jgi:hypothetical protein
MLLDPPIYETRSNTLLAEIGLYMGGDENYVFDLIGLIQTRDTMIIKYNRLRDALIYNFHLILATAYVNTNGLLSDKTGMNIMNILDNDPLFDEALFQTLRISVNLRDLDVDAIRQPTASLVRTLANCDPGRATDLQTIRGKCGFSPNMPLLNLLGQDWYGVQSLEQARADFEHLFSADRRLDDEDVLLLRQYMEYRISNGSIEPAYR